MSAPRLTGFGLSETLPAGARLRLTWGERTALNPDALFARYFSAMFPKVQPTVGHFAPVNQPGVAPGTTAVSVYFNNHRTRAAAEIISKLTMLNDNFVELKNVELLSGAAAANVTKPAGALALDRVAAISAAETRENSPLLGFANAIGTTLRTATMIAAAVGIILLLFYASVLKGQLRR